jgi:hypothetical protein
VRRTANNTRLSTNYRLGKKTTLDVNLGQVLTDYPVIKAKNWENEDYINYDVTQRVTLGFGGKLGYLEIKNSGHQKYEQTLVRAKYNLSGKLSLVASAGPEWRQLRTVRAVISNPSPASARITSRRTTRPSPSTPDARMKCPSPSPAKITPRPAAGCASTRRS